MQYYQKLKDIRNDNEKSQRQIAQILNITVQQYSLYETGKRSMPIDQYKTLATYYNVSIDYLCGLVQDFRNLNGEKINVADYSKRATGETKNINIKDAGQNNKFNIKQ